jgi:hypothetical protein
MVGVDHEDRGIRLAGERYPYAPVSDLYMFGRAQDLALQKARDNVHQRNHLRLWLSPLRLDGKQVWVGQISRDIGSRVTIHTPTFTTHKIDPDVDEAAPIDAGLGLLPEHREDRLREGSRNRPQEHPARQPHERQLLHRRAAQRPWCSSIGRLPWTSCILPLGVPPVRTSGHADR